MFDVKPKKYLGQHFLKDANIARKIAGSLPDEPAQLLEIGPGTGILTKQILLIEKHQLKMLEIDKESVEYLRNTYQFDESVLLETDFLNYPLENLFAGPFQIIGNFPYNISSQIFFRVLDYRQQVSSVVGMIQKEVAERLASPPGNKQYGILSVLLQAYYNIEYLFTVNESVFVPPPKVKSAVIRLTRNKVEQLPCNESLFRDVVKSCFNTRRKTLRNGLKRFSIPADELTDPIFDKRPEQLGVDDFVRVTNMIKS